MELILSNKAPPDRECIVEVLLGFGYEEHVVGRGACSQPSFAARVDGDGLASRQFRYVDMWSGVLLIAVVGLVLNLLFALVEARVLRWHRESRKRADAS